MSAHVRQVFRSVLNDAAALLPYVETIGVAHDLNHAPDFWTTVEFPLVQAERVSLGYPACYREQGSVFVHVNGRSGSGDEVVFGFAETIRSLFDRPFVQDVHLLGTQPPMLAPTDKGEWLDVVVAVDYRWDYVVTGT